MFPEAWKVARVGDASFYHGRSSSVSHSVLDRTGQCVNCFISGHPILYVCEVERELVNKVNLAPHE